MIPVLFLPKLFLAGGVFLGAFQPPPAPEIMNHTLVGEKIPSSQVVCRSRWGTPMPPDGKGGYSLIAPIKKKLIAQSLWIPPVSGTRPKSEVLPVAVPVPAASVKAPDAPVSAAVPSPQ